MKNVTMYEIGEEILIKAKITEILVDNGEIKYHITAEHSNNPLDHKFTEHQIIPVQREVSDKEDVDDGK